MNHDFNSLSVDYIEQLYAEYLENPAGLTPDWRGYFERLEPGQRPGNGHRNGGGVQLRPSFRPPSIFNPVVAPAAIPATSQPTRLPADDAPAARFQARVEHLVWNFRLQGHLMAHIDPLGFPRPAVPELEPQFFGFTRSDLDRRLPSNPLPQFPVETLGGLFDALRTIYSGHLGVEFMHINDPAIRSWVQRRVERAENQPAMSREEKIHFLARLTDSIAFDQFVLRKYVGSKVFSIEGGEVLIPLLDMAIEKASEQGIVQIVMGMAHRGRLNVLANILGKSPRRIFCEFEDNAPTLSRGGDVKYHLGHSNDWLTRSGRKVRLTLCFNPSHLEFVNPVAEGALRAKEDRAGDVYHEHGMALLIHGDAAMAGEGIVQETLNLSQLSAYATGGTLHVVINNQIGFTTPPHLSRSGAYCTDVAKMLETPILHVNGEEPDAVVRALRMAMDFRHTFRRDVVLDVYCYRRHGHNEGDEPEFTQPVQYNRIRPRKPIRDLYLERLLAENTLTQDEANRMSAECVARLEAEYAKVQSGDVSGPSCELNDVWRGYRAGRETIDEKINTAVDQQALVYVLRRLTHVPDDFHVHPKLEKWLAKRRSMAVGEQPMDWAAGEALALATLVMDGYRVRLTGQDSGRGTFSQRHAVMHDAVDGHAYCALQNISPDQAPLEIVNSPLSEAGALGFEYGYSLDYPDCLVAWEAQFGDFTNVAQVVIDQFLCSAEEKWSHLSGITLLLPHGFEGQGPEHSSARLERFLNLASEHNIQVVVPTTPAQYFHVLRRQMLRRWLKPLVVITPKSLLRHPKVVSPMDEFTGGRFQRVIADRDVPPAEVKRIVLCSGKVYYELVDKRAEAKRHDVAIVRLEQLYPFPEEQLRIVLDGYPQATTLVWAQEEPANMGAAAFLVTSFRDKVCDRFPLNVVARYPSSSPATGSARIHRQEQQRVLAEALELT